MLEFPHIEALTQYPKLTSVHLSLPADHALLLVLNPTSISQYLDNIHVDQRMLQILLVLQNLSEYNI